MPGIVGIISRRPVEHCEHLLESMLACMNYEQFYTSGKCTAPELGVYTGWTAHENSLASTQANGCHDKDVSMVFSGEYIPAKLSTSPNLSTTYLIELYKAQGMHFAANINGLFSGLIIDRNRKKTLLFNDRYGIERIYYHERNGELYFASELKSLLAILPELRSFDDDGVAQFLTYGCTLEGLTLFKGIKILPGASLWVFDENLSNSKNFYFNSKTWENQTILSEDNFETEFIETFHRIIPRYLSAAQKTGISLTGGLDTRMIASCIPESAVKPVCYTFSGLTGDTLDATLAAKISKTIGLDHHTLRLDDNFIKNYGGYLDKTVFVTDGCAGALTAHEIYFNAQARQLSPIRLTGNFGSEILRSMSTFKPMHLTDHLFDGNFSQKLKAKPIIDYGEKHHPVSFSAFKEIPWNLYGSLAAGKSQLTFRSPYLDNEIVALAYRAPPNSRSLPNSALRLINEMNPNLGAIPTDRGLLWRSNKVIQFLRRVPIEVSFKLDYYHKDGLPNALKLFEPCLNLLDQLHILGQHKYLPYRLWFKRELAGYLSDTVSGQRFRQMPYWNSSFLKTIVDDHQCGNKNYLKEINALLTLEAVDRLLIRGSYHHPKIDNLKG